MNKQIQAYKELQSVIEKYPEEFKHDYDLKNFIDTLNRLDMQERECGMICLRMLLQC